MSMFHRRWFRKNRSSNSRNHLARSSEAVFRAASQAVEDLESRRLLSVSFAAPITTTLASGFTESTFASADVNGDGISDLVITTVGGSNNVDLVLLGNGDGTFSAQDNVVLEWDGTPHRTDGAAATEYAKLLPK